MPFEANTTFSHYKILHSLGAGGMGKVFKAHDARLDRDVAIKLLPSEFAKDAERLKRFEQEAKATSALNHPNILTIFEFGEEGGTHYLVSEFIDGETLRSRLQAGPLSVSETLDILIQTVQALAAAHEAGIIHRDIKPENVMLRKDGIVKVLDFGLAKLVETTPMGSENETRKLGMTNEGTVLGTVAYMSPEQALGKVVDARTDQFSLGVMLYEMLSRRQPFTGETVNHVIVAILEKEPIPPAGIPIELKRILEKSLAKNAADRYSNVKAMLGELKKLQTRLLVEMEIGGKPEREIVADTLIEARTAILSPTTVGTPEVVATAARPNSSDIPKQMKWWIAAALSLFLVVSGVFGYKKIFPPKRINSIAVIPFENRNSDADTDYLSDGLAESVIFRLTQLPDLKVSPTSSVMRYKGKETDISKISSELGVDAVMTGRLTKRGDNLTITVELVDARTNKSLWGEQYERKLSELLTTQREIVTEIVGKLQPRLSGESEQKLAKTYTDNNEAYQLYLKGRYYWNKRDEESIRKAIEQFKAAADKDPSYALAFVGLADCYALLPIFSNTSSGSALPKANAYATRALKIDDSLGEVHASLGLIQYYLWDWAEAEKSFKRSIELNPNYASAHLWFGVYLLTVGRYDEAEIQLKRAIELEPLVPIFYQNLASIYFRKGDLSAAAEQNRRGMELDPNISSSRLILADLYLKQGRNNEAIAEAEKRVTPVNRSEISLLGYVYAKTGRKGDALKIVEELKDRFQKQQADGLDIARLYCVLGDKEQTLFWLEKEYQSHSQKLPLRLAIGWFDFLRGDPRYTDLLKRMGLPE